MGDLKLVQGRDPKMVDADNFEVWTVRREWDTVAAIQLNMDDEDVKHISLVHKMCSRDEVNAVIKALEEARDECWPTS